jgi:hypothetical protein
VWAAVLSMVGTADERPGGCAGVCFRRDAAASCAGLGGCPTTWGSVLTNTPTHLRGSSYAFRSK